MRRAQLAAIRRVQQTSRSIQARRAENGADRYGHQPFFGLRYDFGIGRRDRATSKVSSRAYRRLTEPSAVTYRCWASVDEEYRPKRVVQRFFLFWRHGGPAARNSPACKGKSLRCLRKCRLSYIDTSPALSARRHLTAALRYSARPPQRPSRSHLGYQIHQTYYFAHLQSRPHRTWVACCAHQVQSFDLIKSFGAGVASTSKFLAEMN